MTVSHGSSNCSRGVPVDVYWRYCAGGHQVDHVEAAVASLFDAVSGRPGRLWGPFNRLLVEAKFRDRLHVASSGNLKPIDEVKVLRNGQSMAGLREVLYEIRWSDIGVTDSDPGPSGRVHYETDVRLLYSEPNQLGYCMLGLLTHEKHRDDDQAKLRQDEAIARAERCHIDGLEDLWGVSNRSA